MYYSLPIFRLPEFAAGVFYAVWILRDRARIPTGLNVATKFTAAAIFLPVTSGLVPFSGHDVVLIPFLLSLFAYTMTEGKSVFLAIISSKPLVFLGEVSFGIYIMQILIISFYKKYILAPFDFTDAVACFALTIVAAAIVRFVVEKPVRVWILKHKESLA